MHAQAAIHRDSQAGDMSDLTISNIKENPPSVTGKRNIDFTVSSAATNRVYHCIRSDYSVHRFGTRDLNPESPGIWSVSRRKILNFPPEITGNSLISPVIKHTYFTCVRLYC